MKTTRRGFEYPDSFRDFGIVESGRYDDSADLLEVMSNDSPSVAIFVAVRDPKVESRGDPDDSRFPLLRAMNTPDDKPLSFEMVIGTEDPDAITEVVGLIIDLQRSLK